MSSRGEDRKRRRASVLIAGTALALSVALGSVAAGSAAGPGDDEEQAGAPAAKPAAKLRTRSGRVRGKHVLVRALRAPRKGPSIEDDDREGAETEPDDPKDKVDPPNRPPMTGARSAATTVPLTVLRNTPIAGAADTSVVEPTAANDRNAILATGNHFIALSRDNGATYPEFLDTNTLFPRSLPGNGFVGDATAISVPRDGYALTVVAGLTIPDAGGNAVQFAVFDGSRDELTRSTGVDESDVCTFSFSAPGDFGFDSDTWLDYPQVSMTDKWLYATARASKLTNNVIKDGGGSGAYRGEVIWRVEIDDIVDECALADPQPTYQFFVENREESAIALVNNADTTMFMAQHITKGVNDKLRLWKWTDASALASGPFEANIADWPSRNKTQKCKLDANTSLNPCERNDGRLHVGYRSGSTVGWVWTSAQGTEGENFDWPHLRVVSFDTGNLASPVQDIPMFENNYAVTYPSVGVNGAGKVAMVYYRMGGNKTLDARAWITSTPRDWNVSGTTLRASTNAPTSNTWGDYATVRKYDQCPAIFLAGVHAMQGGGNVSNSEADYSVFGPEGEGCPDYTVQSLGFLSTDDFSRTIDRGEDLFVTGTVTNTGFVDPNRSSRVSFWLSKNPKHKPDATDPNDIRLSPTIQVPTVAPLDGALFNQIRVTVPADTPGGEYYLIACADDAKQIDEISEDDNCVSEPEAGTNGAPLTVKYVLEKQDLGVGSFNPRVNQYGTGSTSRTRAMPVRIDATGYTAREIDRLTFTVQASPTRAVGGPRPIELPVFTDKVAKATGAAKSVRQTRNLVLRLPKRIRKGSRWFLRVCVKPAGRRADAVTRNDCRVSKRAVLLRR